MPGGGLTAIGLAGLVTSYSGIAHTFIDGMHALTGLLFMFGLISTHVFSLLIHDYNNFTPFYTLRICANNVDFANGSVSLNY